MNAQPRLEDIAKKEGREDFDPPFRLRIQNLLFEGSNILSYTQVRPVHGKGRGVNRRYKVEKNRRGVEFVDFVYDPKIGEYRISVEYIDGDVRTYEIRREEQVEGVISRLENDILSR